MITRSLCCSIVKNYAVRKSDLDMARLVEHLSNPVSKCIPQCMYIRLQAGADSGTISTEPETTVNSKRQLFRLFCVPEWIIGGPQQKKMAYCCYDTLKEKAEMLKGRNLTKATAFHWSRAISRLFHLQSSGTLHTN